MMETSFACGERVDAGFSGRDSAHGYRLEPARGALVAVYGSVTGARLAEGRAGSGNDNEARVRFVASAATSAVVAAWTVGGAWAKAPIDCARAARYPV
jgi:hypothetical protein